VAWILCQKLEAWTDLKAIKPAMFRISELWPNGLGFGVMGRIEGADML
jgi:hypothetical protein